MPLKENNPIVSFLNKASDLILLNGLILFFCLSVITVGAALTAGHFAALRLLREEGKVIPDFWASFRSNFKQATGIWLGFLAAATGVLAILYFFGKDSVAASIACVVVLMIGFLLMQWVFPLLSRFVYSGGNVIRNGMLLCLKYLFRTLAMSIVALVPIAVLSFNLLTFPFILLWGLSVPIYLSAVMYNKVFLSLEERVIENLTQ